MTTHLSWETLNDVADNLLPASEHEAAVTHLAGCDSCNTQLYAIRALRDAVTGAPDTVEPPPEVWTEIQHTINARKTVTFPQGTTPVGVTQMTRRQLAVAALVLVAATSTITAVVMRQPTTSRAVSDASVATAAPTVSTAAASDIVLMEKEYLTTAASLRDALNRERSALAPSTIATVERNLKIIDDAIAEARQAFMADPANTALRDMLRKSHQHKIDFLRRTTSLLEQA